MHQGENLWTGTRGAYRYDEMMGHWLGERRNFVNLPVPESSRTGQFGDVGHYTQIVWGALHGGRLRHGEQCARRLPRLPL